MARFAAAYGPFEHIVSLRYIVVSIDEHRHITDGVLCNRARLLLGRVEGNTDKGDI